MAKAKFQYEATFSNGDKLARGSNREFKFAWCVRDHFTNRSMGFSTTRDAAIKASCNSPGNITFSEVVEL